MKHLLLVSLLLPFTAFAVSHYYPLEFQSAVERNVYQDEELKEEIYILLSSPHQRIKNGPDKLGCDYNAKGSCYRQINLGYKGARKILFGKLHLEEDKDGYYIKDVYCNKDFRGSDIGPKKIPDSNKINCEHTWPQSRFSSRGGKGDQKSDLHHLFPTESRANGIRGNYKFGDTNNPRRNNKLCSASRQTSRGKFEPPTEHKGNVARALFYFSIRYRIQISSDEEETLKRWHELDPVDGAERERNEEIFNVQNNRNPFIDYPELVDHISNF